MDDELHEARMQIGTFAMAAQDLLGDDELIERISDTVERVRGLFGDLEEKGWAREQAFGFLQGVLLAAVREG